MTNLNTLPLQIPNVNVSPYTTFFFMPSMLSIRLLYRTLISLVWFSLTSALPACTTEKPQPEEEHVHRVFIRGQEITDAAVKKRFIQHLANPFTISPADGPGNSLHFTAPDTAFFRPYPQRFTVSKTGTQYLFYSPFTPPVTNPYTLGRILSKYTAPLVPVPFTVGEYTTQEVRVGYERDGAVQLAVLLFRLRQPQGGSRGYTEQAGILFNEFNEAALTSLRAGDTLAVQLSHTTITIQ